MEGHLLLVSNILGYLRKYPKCGCITNPKNPRTAESHKDIDTKQDFGYQYSYFKKEVDSRFQRVLVAKMDINIFINADHGHDKVTGRSVTRLVDFVDSTPVVWVSKRQSSVHTSTFGAKFTDLKKAVEDAITIRYQLIAIEVRVSKPFNNYVDNMRVVINATNPSSTLNKKIVTLSYHFVGKHAANEAVAIKKIGSKENYVRPYTKALSSNEHHNSYYEYRCN
eukprot:6082608-Ditylum_brightwellii.AAC.1